MIRKQLKHKKCYECSYYKSYLKEKSEMMRKTKRKKPAGLFFKMLVGIVIAHGMFCVTMSYMLAWTEHTQIVEGVSSTLITEVVAPIIIYGFTKTIENVFEKNKLNFSEPIQATGAEEREVY